MREAWTTAAVDSRCLADPACAALRPVTGGRNNYIDISGTVHFTMTLSAWTATPELWIRNSNLEDYQLSPVAPLTAATVTPEPATIALVATGLSLVGGAARRRRLIRNPSETTRLRP